MKRATRLLTIFTLLIFGVLSASCKQKVPTLNAENIEKIKTTLGYRMGTPELENCALKPTLATTKDEKPGNSVECSLRLGVNGQNWFKKVYGIDGKEAIENGRPKRELASPWNFSAFDDKWMAVQSHIKNPTWISYVQVPNGFQSSHKTHNELYEIDSVANNQPLQTSVIEDASGRPADMSQIKEKSRVAYIAAAVPNVADLSIGQDGSLPAINVTSWTITLQVSLIKDLSKNPKKTGFFEMTTNSLAIFNYAVEVLKRGKEVNVSYFEKMNKTGPSSDNFLIWKIEVQN